MGTAREKQIDTIKTMFNFNNPHLNLKNETNWKILIYDDVGHNIISPHFSLKDLRELGITLNLHIDSIREQIPDVAAIYFISPSIENVERIGKDCGERLYEKFYLNFISPISRSHLDILAALCIKSDTVDLIAKVYDQYLNFIALEDNLIVLNQVNNRPSIGKQSKKGECNDNLVTSSFYYGLNRQNVKDLDMEMLLDKIVDNLFSVFTTLVQVPVIYSAKGNAAQMIAERLHKKIQENLKDPRNNLFVSNDNFSLPHSSSFSSRSCLIILDRSMDMTTPLVHTWTYQALIQDIFDYELNKIVVDEDDPQLNETVNPTKKSNKKTYDLHHNDKFWIEHKGSPFPSVAEAIQVELENYKSKEGEIRKLKQSMGVEGNESEALLDVLSGNTTALSNVVNSLPQLLERKKFLDMHTNIATALLDQVKHRKLDQFFEIEEKIIAKSSHIECPLFEFLQNTENGTALDKMRLFLVAFLTEYISQADIEKYMTLFKEMTIHDTSAYGSLVCCVEYLTKLKNFMKLATSTGPAINTASFEPKKISMFSKLVTHGSQFVMEGVQNFIVKQHKLPFTRIVDRLTENNTGSKKSSTTLGQDDPNQFLYFDPKLLRAGAMDPQQGLGGSYQSINFSNVYVCVAGGGNFTEYQNLLDYAKTKVNKNVSYIVTDLISPNQFMDQLTALGNEVTPAQ